MKPKMLTAALAALFLSAAAGAQTPEAIAAEFSPDAFRAHVAFLADDLLEGRETGSRGYEIGAHYVATRLSALGLQPGAGDEWLQPVRFVRYRIKGVPSLTLDSRAFEHGRDLIVRAHAETEAADLRAPLVFAGFGLDLPSRGFDDYSGIDARGKIVVVLSGYPQGVASDVGAHLNAEKAKMAAARGAVGMIVVRTKRDADNLPWERMVHYADRPGTTWIGPDGQAFQGSALRFAATADRPLAEALFRGAPQSLKRVLDQAARNGRRPRGFDLGREVRFQREGAVVEHFSSPNVVGILPGTDPALAGEYVLLMAHLDGLGVAEASDDADADIATEAQQVQDRIRNGAMDNATGVATLIEVARQMSLPGNQPRRPVLFAAVTAEEVGLLGADFLARHPVVDGRVVAVVNLDMPILTYRFEDVIAFGAEHSTLGPIVERAAGRMNVALSGDPLPQEGLFTRSDHYRFVQQGVPSVFLMTGFANQGAEKFTSFLRGEYHSPKDDMALPFDWEAGARFARLNYLIAREIANGDRAPLWYGDSFFAEAVAGGQDHAERPAGGDQAATR